MSFVIFVRLIKPSLTVGKLKARLGKHVNTLM